jgi:hypothetical protein
MFTNDKGKNKKGNDEMNRLRRQTMALPDGIDKQRDEEEKNLLFWFSTANNRQSLKPIRKEGKNQTQEEEGKRKKR